VHNELKRSPSFAWAFRTKMEWQQKPAALVAEAAPSSLREVG